MSGLLLAVQNIRRFPQEASIRWIAPFSLNLTYIEPDIAYCVDVFNITCGRRDLVIERCNLTTPNYFSRSILHTADLYEIIVTPRSNVMGSEYGISNKIEGRWITFIINYDPMIVNWYLS